MNKKEKISRRRVELSVCEGVIGKDCSCCGEWKSLNEFRTQKAGLGNRAPECRLCKSKRDAQYRREKATNISEYHKNHRKENAEKYHIREKIYREGHKKEIAEYKATHQQEKPLIYIMASNRRRARKNSLPDDLTLKQYKITIQYFNNACALTGRTDNIEKEHAIPISVGHGGTTFGNCYPLSKELNISKSDKNIFEWFEANRQRFELSQERFDNLIAYLASANAITVEEYRDHVYWCHANPRSINDLEAQ